MKKAKMNVLVLTGEKLKKRAQASEVEFKKYFDMNITYDIPSNIEKHLNQNINILFLDDTSIFKGSYYKSFKDNNQRFTYIALKEKPSKDDVAEYKVGLVDRIIYTDVSKDLLKWTIISALRRYWNHYSKPSTIIYKNIIADFIDDEIIVDKKKISLTPKEVKILKILLENRKNFVSKKFIFQSVWGFADEDSTRTVDQTLFKLRKKIGEEYFKIARNRGVKFE